VQRSREAIHVVVAGGGTGGHVQPAVAVVDALRRRVSVHISWVGSHAGYERDVAPRLGVDYYPIATGKLRRYASLQTPIDALRIPLGIVQAWRLLRRLRPDVVYSTGGFVSVPTVVAARLARIPSISHEQTAVSGLANRINARLCDVIAVSYPESAGALEGKRARIVVTGNPVRSSVLAGDKASGLRLLGFSETLPVVYVTGGTLGAHALNESVRTLIPRAVEHCQIVHQCGPEQANGDLPRLHHARDQLPEMLRSHYVIAERFADELPDVLAAASLVIGRAGASTVAEIAALAKPSILIPLPGASGDEQTHNANVLSDRGGAILLPQTEMTPDRLLNEILGLIHNERRLRDMSCAAASVAVLDAADRLASEILTLAGVSDPRR
jgi:UDP-N-acetylglucosamine--N-acetylmuramyl-(pentapeptide) pyrophosphoryl-undecaprenol N-acetylglucosamine transferase